MLRQTILPTALILSIPAVASAQTGAWRRDSNEMPSGKPGVVQCLFEAMRSQIWLVYILQAPQRATTSDKRRTM